MRINRILQNSQVEFVFNQVSLLLVSISLILILMGLQAKEYVTYFSKAKTTEGLSLVTTIKQDVSAYYMETGRWPEAYVNEDMGRFGSVESITFDGEGGIHIIFNSNSGLASGKTLSFVAATSRYIETGNIVWVCGLANPPESYVLTSTSKTNLPKSLVTPSCRHIER